LKGRFNGPAPNPELANIFIIVRKGSSIYWQNANVSTAAPYNLQFRAGAILGKSSLSLKVRIVPS
jgi:hypothetical protein